MDVVPKRFGRYGLTVHPTKTKLVPFRPPSSTVRNVPRGDRPGTFDLLGFTHYWARSLRGHWVVKKKTASKRITRTMRSLREWCRVFRHLPVRDQHAKLRVKLLGHFNYFGVIGNFAALRRVWYEARRIWHTWLSRRSRTAYIPWGRFELLLKRYPLPAPSILKPDRRSKPLLSTSRMR